MIILILIAALLMFGFWGSLDLAFTLFIGLVILGLIILGVILAIAYPNAFWSCVFVMVIVGLWSHARKTDGKR